MSSQTVNAVLTLEYFEMGARLDASLRRDSADPAFAPAQDPLELAALAEAATLERIRHARAEAAAEVDQHLRSEWAVRELALQAKTVETIHLFNLERSNYFARIEAEVVNLSLGIARKILEREAQTDPTLLGALVRIALDRMQSGPAVRLRVAPAQADWWKSQDAFANSRYQCEIVPDPSLDPEDCLVETELGSANFSFAAQLKEIERGFLDLMAHRPIQN